LSALSRLFPVKSIKTGADASDGARLGDLFMDGERGPFDIPVVGIVDDCGDARGESIAGLGNSEDDDRLSHGGIGHA